VQYPTEVKIRREEIMTDEKCPLRDFLNGNNCLLTDRDCLTSHPNECRGFKLFNENAELKAKYVGELKPCPMVNWCGSGQYFECPNSVNENCEIDTTSFKYMEIIIAEREKIMHLKETNQSTEKERDELKSQLLGKVESKYVLRQIYNDVWDELCEVKAEVEHEKEEHAEDCHLNEQLRVEVERLKHELEEYSHPYTTETYDQLTKEIERLTSKLKESLEVIEYFAYFVCNFSDSNQSTECIVMNNKARNLLDYKYKIEDVPQKTDKSGYDFPDGGYRP
jgi:hypothetical protein